MFPSSINTIIFAMGLFCRNQNLRYHNTPKPQLHAPLTMGNFGKDLHSSFQVVYNVFDPSSFEVSAHWDSSDFLRIDT